MQRLFLILIFLPIFAFSQGLDQRIEVEKSITVLQNEQNLVPFFNLDTLKISYVSLGEDDGVFLKSMRRYTDISTENDESNLLILAIYNTEYEQLEQILNQNKNIVICLFNNDTFIGLDFNLSPSTTVIETAFADSLAKDYLGQFLFGAFGENNKNLRFKYTIPAELGLDSAYIFQKIDSIANYAIETGATPGCQVFAAINQKVFINKSYGFHTFDSIIPVRNTDLYDLASITKISASAPALMKLSDDNYININENFSKYWKPFRHSNKKEISMLDMMCHQGQLTPWIPFWKETLNKDIELSDKVFSSHYSKKYSLQVADSLYIEKKYRKHIYKAIKKSPLLEEKKYKYSDLSFYFYPQIVENLVKVDFETYLDDNFYSKLGANSLCFNPLRYFSKDEIIPTEFDKFFRKQLIHGYVHDEGAAMLGGVSGHAGLFGNANDLAKLAQMYLNYGEYGGERYIVSTTLKKWTSYQFAELGNRRGIIFDKLSLDHPEWGTPSPSVSANSFGHTGFTGTFVWADPDTGLLFVFLSNRVYPTRENKKLLHENIRTNIHQVLYDAIKLK